jgi:hypothetical protein
MSVCLWLNGCAVSWCGCLVNKINHIADIIYYVIGIVFIYYNIYLLLGEYVWSGCAVWQGAGL